MFPAFTVIASDQLLDNFKFQDQFQDVSQNIAWALIDKKAAVVIDVRTPQEYAQGHVPGAYNIPLQEIEKSTELNAIKEADVPVLLYCRSGRRSGIAGEYLYKQGFKKVMNFGGVITWEYDLTKEVPTQPLSEAVKQVQPLP